MKEHLTIEDLKRWAKEQGLPELSPETLAKFEEVRRLRAATTKSRRTILSKMTTAGQPDTFTEHMKSKRTPLGICFGIIVADVWRKDERGDYPKRVSWNFCVIVGKKMLPFRLTLTPRKP